MFKREIEKEIKKYLISGEKKALFIWGPRRSGKTTILSKIAKELKVRKYNFDFLGDREKFVPRKEILGSIARENKVILIDEVQNYPEATVMIKLLHDEFNTKVIATGSSEIRQKSKDFDTLAGRFKEIYCLPLSIYEIMDNEKPKAEDKADFMRQMADKLQIFGAYPEIYTNKNLSEKEKIDLLRHILDAYVLKDIINIYELKEEKLACDILTKIALQLGQEVSIREIANSLGAYPSTVSNYIEIFIKNYILISLPSFKTNLRRAVSANRKLFFYDLGLRNVLVKDFRELDLRPDKGGVFENFIISELVKRGKNLDLLQNFYFYREYGGAEVDLVLEDYYKKYQSVEIKFSPKEKIKDIFPLSHKFQAINSSNYFTKISEILPC